jgi:hypothetical protein
VIMYGGFAFIVIALLLEDGRHINSTLRHFGAFVNIFIPIIPFLYAFHRYMGDDIPKWSGYNVPVLQISGEVTAHLAGAAVFALVGFRKMTPLWVIALFATVVMASASSRGGMLAFVLPVIFAALVVGKLRALLTRAGSGATIFSLQRRNR